MGAGVGGLTAAVALERAGVPATVFERAESLLDVGAGFSLTSNAVAALGELGLAERVAAAGTTLERFEHRTSSGKLLAAWPTGRVAEKVGAPIVGIGRADLHRMLAGALSATEVETGRELVGLDQDEAGVTARFADGGEARGDALVGAEGSRSTVRGLFDPTPRRYSGYTTWLALAERESPAPGTHTQWYGRRAIFGAHPVGAGRTYWYASKTAPPGEVDGDTKADLLELFGGWHEEVPALIAATGAIARTDVYDLPRRDSWGSGRVTLLGDAAHAMAPALGQGACQAIEDGVVLARHLAGCGDVVEALRAYERQRIARTAPLAKRARMQGRLMQGDTRLVAAARTASFRFAPTGRVLKSFEKILTFER